MSLSKLFSHFTKKNDRKTLIRELVIKLRFDASQEKLYLDSLDILSDVQLDCFYKKLIETIGSVENRIVHMHGSNNAVSAIKQVKYVRGKEKQEKENGYNFLLDNLS